MTYLYTTPNTTTTVNGSTYIHPNTYQHSYMATTKNIRLIGEYMDIEYVSDVNGVIIPMVEITQISHQQFKDPEGLMSSLAEDAFNERTCLFVKVAKGTVHIIDFNSNYNRDNFEYVSTYDADLKKKVFLHQYAKMKNKA